MDSSLVNSTTVWKKRITIRIAHVSKYPATNPFARSIAPQTDGTWPRTVQACYRFPMVQYCSMTSVVNLPINPNAWGWLESKPFVHLW
jgi:hypothetical protein